MDDNLSGPHEVSRRKVAAGAFWALPAVVAATAAPAMAASPMPRLTMGATGTWNKPFYESVNTCFSGAPYIMDGRGILGTGYREWDGIWFPDAKATDQICNLTMTFWFARNNVTWSALPGVTDWSLPAPTGATTSYQGLTYYEYRAVYRNGACVTAGSLRTGYNGWYGVAYGWRTTSCYTARPGAYLRVGSTATIRNVDLTHSSAWTSMS